MLDALETLVVLSRAGTMSRAAERLRVTQSTVSKRLAALEARLERNLIEPDGRRVRLTPDGQALVERTAPLLVALRDALLPGEGRPPLGRLVVGVSELVLASWGAGALARARDRLPGLDLVVHAHRSPVAVERVRAGEYAAALVAGRAERAPDLTAVPLCREEMVLVAGGGDVAQLRRHLRRARRSATSLPVVTIEPASATWRSLRSGLVRLRDEADLRLVARWTVESFPAVIRMALEGFGHGLAPRPLAEILCGGHAPPVRLPGPGLERPVSLVARRGSHAGPLVAGLREALLDILGEDVPGGRQHTRQNLRAREVRP